MTQDIPLRYKIAAAALVPLIIFSSLFGLAAWNQVPEGHVAVEKEWDAVNGQVHNPGQEWTVPLKQDLQYVETRPRTYTMSDTAGEGNEASRADAIEAPTNDGVMVRIDVTVRYNVEAENADEFVKEWNNEEQAEQRLIRPAVRSSLRDEAAGISTDRIYTDEGRAALAEAAREALEDELEGEAMHLQAVQVRNVNLPDDYDQMLTEKEVAKQEVQREEHLVEKAEKEKERKIIEAEAEAEQIEIKGEAIEQNPEVIELRRIEAIKDNDNTVYIPHDSGLTMTKEADDSGN